MKIIKKKCGGISEFGKTINLESFLCKTNINMQANLYKSATTNKTLFPFELIPHKPPLSIRLPLPYRMKNPFDFDSFPR